MWRRLLVISETSLAELHEILQSAFDWSGEHLHRFLIHGAAYGDSVSVRHHLPGRYQGLWDAMLTIEFAIPTSGMNCERTAVLALCRLNLNHKV